MDKMERIEDLIYQSELPQWLIDEYSPFTNLDNI